MRFWHKTKGAVSIFLVIILVPMMTVSALFVDSSKLKLASSVAESAGDLALNTALTNYDKLLKDMYGIFATAQDTDEIFTRIEDYYRKSITSSGVSLEDANSYVDQIMAQLGMLSESNDTSDILNMQLIDFEIRKVKDANLANATIIKDQIVNFMKYRAPINAGLSFLSSLKSFSTLSQQTNLVDKRKVYYEEQQSAMESAHKAWKFINEYNSTELIQKEDFFTKIESDFATYQTQFEDLAKETIKDIYKGKGKTGFNPYLYSMGEDLVEFDRLVAPGVSETINREEMYFYTNKAKTSWLTLPHEYASFGPKYNSYHDIVTIRRPTDDEFRSYLSAVQSAYETYKNREIELFEIGTTTETHSFQYLVQTNRYGSYENWVKAMMDLYDAYAKLEHAYEFAEQSVRSEKVGGEGFYDVVGKFSLARAMFNTNIGKYNTELQRCRDSISPSVETRMSNVTNKLDKIYQEANNYRTQIATAKENLEKAIPHLNDVHNRVKSGGTLDTAKANWGTAANDSELRNTPLARQDQAEIGSLDININEQDVLKLKERLEAIVENLGKMLDQIDSYTFFGEPIIKFRDYNYLEYTLQQKIGDNILLHLPTKKTDLETKAKELVEGKFVIGEKVKSTWSTQQNSRAKLHGSDNQLRFYSYLYTKFNVQKADDNGSQTPSIVPKSDKKDDTEKDIDNIDKQSGEEVKKKEEEAADTEGEAKPGDTQISTKPNLPSKDKSSPSGSESKPTGKEGTEDSSKNLATMFDELGRQVKKMGTDLRDNLYVSDYVMSMFTYDTIEKEFRDKKNKDPGDDDLLTLTNKKMSAKNNLAYRREVEYIVFGGTNESNIKKAYASIYGIRFGFNVIYAFMDSEIRDTAFAIATPLSAATMGIVPVPLIQAVIIIGIACIESGIDLIELRAGRKVPLFKNSKTWTTKPSGLAGKVIDEFKEAATDIAKNATEWVVDEGLTKLNELLDAGNDELTEVIDGKTEDIIEYVEDSYDSLITRHAETAIQKLQTLCDEAIQKAISDPIDGITGQVFNKTEFIKNKLDEWLEKEAQGVDVNSDLAYIVKKEAVEMIKSQESYITDLMDAITEAGNTAGEEVEGAIMGPAKKIMDLIENIRKEIKRKIIKGSEKVKQYKDKMVQEVRESMAKGASELKETLNKQIDGMFDTMGEGVESGDIDNTGLSSLLSFRYSDYLRLFVIVGLYAKPESVLLRTADVIQVNMVKASEKDDYRLANSAVYVEVEANIQVKPTLLAVPLFAEVEGNPTSNSDWYSIKYHNIKGY